MDEGELDGELAWSTKLPLSLLERRPDESTEFIGRRNESLLRVLTMGEDSASVDESESRGRQRLEAKLDLLLAALAQREGPDVLPCAITLSASGIRFSPIQPVSPGSEWWLSLWLSVEQPFPLVLAVRATRGSNDDDVWSFLFEGLSAEESDLLERFIFQQHRRAVAAARKGRD
jgi:hypothetical protein